MKCLVSVKTARSDTCRFQRMERVGRIHVRHFRLRQVHTNKDMFCSFAFKKFTTTLHLRTEDIISQNCQFVLESCHEYDSFPHRAMIASPTTFHTNSWLIYGPIQLPIGRFPSWQLKVNRGVRMLTAMSLLRYGNGYIWTMMSTTEPYTLLLHGAPQSPHLLLLLKLYCAPALSAVWCYRQCQCYTSTLKQYSASTPNCTLNYAQPT